MVFYFYHYLINNRLKKGLKGILYMVIDHIKLTLQTVSKYTSVIGSGVILFYLIMTIITFILANAANKTSNASDNDKYIQFIIILLVAFKILNM